MNINKDYLSEQLNKDSDLYNVILENSIMRESLIRDVPILLTGKKDDGKLSRLKDIVLSTEEIFLSSIHDLSGTFNTMFDQEKFNSMKYMVDNKELSMDELINKCRKYVSNKPEWLVSFEERCNREPNKLHVLTFCEIEKATSTVLRQLINMIDSRMVDGKWKLLDNARIVLVSSNVKNDNKVMDDLYKRVVLLEINSPIENWFKLRNLQDISSSLDFKREDIIFNPELAAYILCKFWRDKEDVLGLRNNVNKLCVVSSLMKEFNQEDVLKIFMKEEYIKDFYNFCNKYDMNIDDVISEDYFSDKDIDITRDILMYFLICGEDNADKRRKASSKFVQYDCENNGLILVDLYFWTNMNNDEKLLNFMDLAKKTTMQRLFEKNDINKLSKK